MKRDFLAVSIAIAVAIGSIVIPLANAAANDSTIFNLVKSAGAVYID